MWCNNCNQDVPGIASLVESEELVCCARCGEELDESTRLVGRAIDDEPTEPEPDQAGSYEIPGWNNWELDEKLYDVDRLLSELGPLPSAAEGVASHWPCQPSGAASGSHAKNSPTRKPARRRRSSWLAWLVLGLGLMTFVCGSVLLGWSFFTDKTILWRLGMPLSLLGQAGLLIGLILQLEGLWQNDHEATETLDDLDQQITELRHAAAMLNATHSRPGQSFYLHMAEGASPHLMLADLKSQLDLLAVQMEKHRR